VELHDYLALVRRYLIALIAVPLVIAALAYVQSSRKPDQFTATAIVLLRPNDPNERLGTSSEGGTEQFNADRFVRAQANVVRGPDVVAAAAAFLGDRNSKEVAGSLTVSPAVDSNILRISATTESPEDAQSTANAVSDAFIENRRKSSVKGLERALENINVKIDEAAAELEKVGSTSNDPTSDAELASAQEQFAALSKQRVELEIDLDLKRGEAELIAPAELPIAPVSPKPVRSATLAWFAALAACFGAALLRDRLDFRLRSREEAESLTGLATLAEIPLDRGSIKDSTRLAASDEPDGIVAEAVRSLRVSLRFQGLDKPLNVVLITSATPGDGKSTLAGNLAVSYAQSGLRTLLVSADLRRPRVERLTEATKEQGFTELLTEMAVLRERTIVESRRRSSRATESTDGVRETRARGRVATGVSEQGSIEIAAWCHQDTPNLYVLGAGKPVSSPVEILSSAVAHDFFELARRDFEMVIIDTPPVVLVSDPIVLAQHADGVILVASVRKTTRPMLQRASELLEASQVRVVGLVMNRMTKDGGGYYGTYYGSDR
jgi:Mrp family chromosome partitioning ATPase/capsular polysaccharide biosynthesis protein